MNNNQWTHSGYLVCTTRKNIITTFPSPPLFSFHIFLLKKKINLQHIHTSFFHPTTTLVSHHDSFKLHKRLRERLTLSQWIDIPVEWLKGFPKSLVSHFQRTLCFYFVKREKGARKAAAAVAVKGELNWLVQTVMCIVGGKRSMRLKIYVIKKRVLGSCSFSSIFRLFPLFFFFATNFRFFFVLPSLSACSSCHMETRNLGHQANPLTISVVKIAHSHYIKQLRLVLNEQNTEEKERKKSLIAVLVPWQISGCTFYIWQTKAQELRANEWTRNLKSFESVEQSLFCLFRESKTFMWFYVLYSLCVIQRLSTLPTNSDFSSIFFEGKLEVFPVENSLSICRHSNDIPVSEKKGRKIFSFPHFCDQINTRWCCGEHKRTPPHPQKSDVVGICISLLIFTVKIIESRPHSVERVDWNFIIEMSIANGTENLIKKGLDQLKFELKVMSNEKCVLVWFDWEPFWQKKWTKEGKVLKMLMRGLSTIALCCVNIKTNSLIWYYWIFTKLISNFIFNSKAKWKIFKFQYEIKLNYKLEWELFEWSTFER